MKNKTILFGSGLCLLVTACLVSYLVSGNVKSIYAQGGDIGGDIGTGCENNECFGNACGSIAGEPPPLLNPRATCNADGTATFSWDNVGSKYWVRLNNQTMDPSWAFQHDWHRGGWRGGDFNHANHIGNTFTSPAYGTPQAHNFWVSNSSYDNWFSPAEGVSITCPVMLPTCASLNFSGCTLPQTGGRCDSPVTWSTYGTNNNRVDLGFVKPDGLTYRWSQLFGNDGASPSYSGTFSYFEDEGVWKAQMFNYGTNDLLCEQSFTISRNNVLPPGSPNLWSPASNLGVLGGTTHGVNAPVRFYASVVSNGEAGVTNPFTTRFEATTNTADWSSAVGVDKPGIIPLTVWPADLVGGAYNEWADLTFPTTGTYYVRHCVDTGNTIGEINEGDNCSTAPMMITVTSGAQPLTASCRPSPASVDAGTPTNWTAYVSGGTGAHTITWSGSDGLSGIGPSVSKSYAAAGSYTANITVTDSVGMSTSTSCALPVTVGDGVVPTVDLQVRLNTATNSETWGDGPLTLDGLLNQHIDLRWTTTNASACTAAGFLTGGSFNGELVGVNAITNEPRGTSTARYSMRCTNGTRSATDSVVVRSTLPDPPVVDLVAKSSIIRYGQKAELGWTITNPLPDPVTCTLSGGVVSFPPFTAPTGTTIRNVSTNPYLTNSPLTATQNISLSCVNSAGVSGDDTVRIEVTGEFQNR